MKKLNPTPSLDDVWVPEDGVDRRTAASLEPAFQALLNRSEYALSMVERTRVRALFGPATDSELPRHVKAIDDDGDTLYIPVIHQSSPLQFSVMRLNLNDFRQYAIASAPMPLTNVFYVWLVAYGALYATDRDYQGSASSGLYRSTDGGDTWTQVSNTGLLVLGRNGTTLLAVGVLDGTLHRSTDDGLSWSQVSGAPQVAVDRWKAEWAYGKWWLVDTGSQLHVSSDDGLTWTPVPGETASVVRLDMSGRLWIRSGRYTTDGVSFANHVAFDDPFFLVRGLPVWGFFNEEGRMLYSLPPHDYANGVGFLASRSVVAAGVNTSSGLASLGWVIG